MRYDPGYVDDSNSVVSQRLDERHQHCKDLETTLGRDLSGLNLLGGFRV